MAENQPLAKTHFHPRTREKAFARRTSQMDAEEEFIFRICANRRALRANLLIPTF
jgi:hypothetical protein